MDFDKNKFFLDEYETIYLEGFSGKSKDTIHKIMERPFKNKSFKNVLELGALSGYHKKFVKHNYDLYIESDILIKSDQVKSENYKLIYQDAENLKDFSDNSIDRVIATCLVSHLNNPENCLLEIKRVLKKGGVASIWVANDPSIFLRIFQILFRRREFKKMNLDYDAVLYRLHINHFPQINYLIKAVFKGFTIKKNGIPFFFLNYNFNFATIFHIYKN